MNLTTTLLGFLTLVAAGSAQAAFVATLSQVGNDVVLSGSGSLNLTDLERHGESTFSSAIVSGWAAALSGEGDVTYVAYWQNGMTGPVNFGSTSEVIHTGVGEGDFFGVQGSGMVYAIYVKPDYVFGSYLSGQSIFANITLAEMDVVAGTYVWTWGTGENADTFTLNIIAVPEPAHYAIGAGLAALALVALRRRVK